MSYCSQNVGLSTDLKFLCDYHDVGMVAILYRVSYNSFEYRSFMDTCFLVPKSS